MSLNIDNLTYGELKRIAGLFSSTQAADGLNAMLGKQVIIRTYSAGVWFGTLAEKAGSEVILHQARRMWQWWAKESISLSACAIHGIKHDKSKIVEPVDTVWLEAIEIIPCTPEAVESIEAAPYVKSE